MPTIPVSAKCPCGHPIIWDDSATEETVLICKNCGTNLGTYGDLKTQAESVVRDELKRRFKDLFDRQ